MSLASYASPARIIADGLQAGRKGQLLSKQPDPDTVDHISGLLRRGVLRGIGIQWSLRLPIGTKPTSRQLGDIASQFDEGFSSGTTPFAWRLDVYA